MAVPPCQVDAFFVRAAVGIARAKVMAQPVALAAVNRRVGIVYRPYRDVHVADLAPAAGTRETAAGIVIGAPLGSC